MSTASEAIMPSETRSTALLTQTEAYHSVRCSAQVLVIDRRGGPASVLMDTASRLRDGDLSLTEVERRFDALRALDCFCFDLVVIGVDNDRMVELSLLSEIHHLRPEVPVLVVGDQVPRFFQQYARHYGASEVLNMPRRAAELRDMMEQVIGRYVDASAVTCLD